MRLTQKKVRAAEGPRIDVSQWTVKCGSGREDFYSPDFASGIETSKIALDADKVSLMASR